MLALFPSRTVALDLFGFQIHWYGILYVVSFLVAISLLPRLGKFRNLRLTQDQWLNIVSWAVVGVLVGGRLGFVLLYEPAYYLAHPLEIFAVWQGGMASHGGFIGVISVLAVVLWKEKIHPPSLADIAVVPAAIGLALGRIGNFINQELYGPVTTLPWGVSIPGVAGLRHPTQLYECIADLGIALTCFALLNVRSLPRGRVFAAFLMLYGVGRFLLEYLREQQYSVLAIGSFTLSRGQLYTIPLFAAGVLLWFWFSKAPKGKRS